MGMGGSGGLGGSGADSAYGFVSWGSILVGETRIRTIHRSHCGRMKAENTGLRQEPFNSGKRAAWLPLADHDFRRGVRRKSKFPAASGTFQVTCKMSTRGLTELWTNDIIMGVFEHMQGGKIVIRLHEKVKPGRRVGRDGR